MISLYFKKLFCFLAIIFLFLPIYKFLLPISNEINIFIVLTMMFLLVFISFIKDQKLKISLLFAAILFLLFSLVLTLINLTNFAFIDLIRYTSVTMYCFLVYIFFRNNNFNQDSFIKILIFNSFIIFILHFMGYFQSQEQITYSQISYALFPLMLYMYMQILNSSNAFIKLACFILLIMFIYYSIFYIGARSLIFFFFLIILALQFQKSFTLFLISTFALLLAIYSLSFFISEDDALFISRSLRLIFEIENEPRIIHFKNLLSTIAENPFGFGIGNFESITNGHPHNIFLEFLLVHGILLGFIFSIIFLILFLKAYINFAIFKMYYAQSILSFFFLAWMISNDFGSSYFLCLMIIIGVNLKKPFSEKLQFK